MGRCEFGAFWWRRRKRPRMLLEEGVECIGLDKDSIAVVEGGRV